MIIKNKTPVRNIININNFKKPAVYFCADKKDETKFENTKIDKSVLVEKKIIKEDENINQFFDTISTKIFSDKNKANAFSNLLKEGKISLSSSIYSSFDTPQSAYGVEYKEGEVLKLEKYLIEGQGIGINFSKLTNPVDEIKKINSFFKSKENFLKRPGAGIALLNINNKEILDFINLKTNRDYENWCFDLSVIVDDDFFKKVDNNENITLSDGSKINAKELYENLLSAMKKSGEPGVIFSNNKDFICDCCAAAELKPNEGLTLAHINLSKFYNDEKIDYSSLKNCAKMLSSAMSTIDNNGHIGVLGYQELLDKIGLRYGTKEALGVLDKCLKTIKNNTDKKMAISPTGTISRLLKTTPAIDPRKACFEDELKTMATAQKYLDGGISKTIPLNKNHTEKDIDRIIRYCHNNGIKGICVFPADAPSIRTT